MDALGLHPTLEILTRRDTPVPKMLAESKGWEKFDKIPKSKNHFCLKGICCLLLMVCFLLLGIGLFLSIILKLEKDLIALEPVIFEVKFLLKFFQLLPEGKVLRSLSC